MVASEKFEVLERIPLELDTAGIIKMLRAHGDLKRYEATVNEVIQLVLPIAKPKAMYRIGCVDNKQPNSLNIDGVKFSSSLVCDKLAKVETVFVSVATCGTEVDSLVLPPGDVMKRYCLDAVKNRILFSASGYLKNYLIQRYHLEKISVLNPGETVSFPISFMKNLFSVLGDVEGRIGVRLTENCALVPTKSGCGIYYSSDSEFVSCRICPQKRCHGRRAAYEPELAAQYPKASHG